MVVAEERKGVGLSSISDKMEEAVHRAESGGGLVAGTRVKEGGGNEMSAR
jgi:hypothetical protein